MAIIQQSNGQGKGTNCPSNTTPKNTFICEVCKKELPQKYLHSYSACADCANTKAKSTIQPQSTIKSDRSIRPNTEKEIKIEQSVSENIVHIEYIEYLHDSICERCLNDLSESQVNQGQLNESISWKIVDNILYLSGKGTLTQEDYLVITASAPRYETITYTRVLPWAVCPRIRKSKYISEGCPINEIPTHIKGLAVDGEIEGLEDFLLGANNYIGLQLQSAKEYLYT